MTTEQIWLAVLGAVALGALLVAVLALATARRALSRRDDVPAQAAADPPAPAVEDPVSEHAAWVITGLETEGDHAAGGHADRPAAAGRIDGRLFADIVAREAAVKAASWGHGLRRALSPESRNRIRFEVRQQARRARRDRKVEQREALRHYRSRRDVDERDEDAA